jgi:hypothetical protein
VSAEEGSIHESFKVNWWSPDGPVEGTVFVRPPAFRVDFFRPDRPVGGGTMFVRPADDADGDAAEVPE